MKCGNCDTPLLEKRVGERKYPSCPACKSLWPNADTLTLVHRYRRPVPAGTTLSLTFEPNTTGHNDLVLRLGPWAHRSDSYYYELDHAVDQPANTVRAIRAMLASWNAALAGCCDGRDVFLPHAFFDQCSGWLRCSRHGDFFHIVDGWSDVEGWSFYPSDFAEKAGALVDFHVHGDFGQPITMSRARVQADVEASVNALTDIAASRLLLQPGSC